MNTKKICQSALIAAIVFIVTRFVQIPIPLGYVTIANAVILLSCLLLPCSGGVFAASVGSALADLTSFPIYTVPTLVIKALFPLAFYRILGHTRTGKRILSAAILSALIPVVGYTVTGMIFYGGIVAGLAQLPGLIAEYVINVILFAVFEKQIRKIDRSVFA